MPVLRILLLVSSGALFGAIGTLFLPLNSVSQTTNNETPTESTLDISTYIENKLEALNQLKIIRERLNTGQPVSTKEDIATLQDN